MPLKVPFQNSADLKQMWNWVKLIDTFQQVRLIEASYGQR